MSNHKYVHGYSPRESKRLKDQAETLVELLHHDTIYPPHSRVLEAGCGIGAQTVTLSQNNPQAEITSIDISETSLAIAKEKIETAGFNNVKFEQADIFNLRFEPQSFDHIFLCFVLEHLPNPDEALKILTQFLKPGGTLTAIEGDHGSTFFHPHSDCAMRAVQCLIDLQAQAGGNSLIGRELYPLLTAAGLKNVRVSPRMVYVDDSKPKWVEGFSRNTFSAMVEGVGEQVRTHNLMSEADWARGVADLYRTADGGGTFCYTFFKAVGTAEQSAIFPSLGNI